MKTRKTKNKILKKGIIGLLILVMLMPFLLSLNTKDAYATDTITKDDIAAFFANEDNTTLYIANEEQLRAFADYVNEGNNCSGKTIELLNDIELSDTDWVPIGGTITSKFEGTFEGNDYSIKNMKRIDLVPSATEYFGLFGYVNGTVKNVRVIDSSVNVIMADETVYYGNIAGYLGAKGVITKCYANSDFDFESTEYPSDYYGRLVGYGVEGSTIEYYKTCTCPSVSCSHISTYIGGGVYSLTLIELTNNQMDNKYNIIENAILDETDIYVKFSKVTSDGTIVDMISTKEPTTYVKAGEKIRVEFAFEGYLKVNDGSIKTIGTAVNDSEGNIVNSNLLPKVTLNTPAGLQCITTPIQVLEGVNTDRADVFVYNPITVLIYEWDTSKEDNSFYLRDGEQDLIANLFFGLNSNGQSVDMMYSTTNDGNWDEANLLTSLPTNAPTYTFKSIRKDTVAPGLTISVYPETERASGRYGDNEKIFVEVTSDEKLLSTTEAPEIELSFSNTGVVNCDKYQAEVALENEVALLNSDGTRTWIYSYIIEPGDDGVLGVKLTNGTITDIVGNKTDVTTITTEAQTFDNVYADTVAPQVGITAQKVEEDGTYTDIADGATTNADKIKFTMTFSEQVQGFEFSDIKNAISGGTLDETSFTGPSENNGSYVYTVEATTEESGICKLRVETAVCKDLIGLDNVRDEISITVDKEAKLTITASESNPTNAESITYTFTFNESVEGFTKDDIEVSNGTKGDFTTIDSSKYTLVVTNDEYETCEQTVSVAAGKCIDTVGNGNVAASLTIKVDRILPTLEITADPEGPTNAESIIYTFTFSEAVEEFTKDSVTVVNGTKGEFTGSGKVYTLVVTNTGSCEQKVVVAENACTDAAENGNTKDEIVVEIDRTEPTLEITADKQSPTNAESITYTFTFSEEVEGFTKDDITVTNGTKGQFTDNGNVYTLVVTNAGSCEQTVSVAAGVCADLVGNKNTTGASKTITIVENHEHTAGTAVRENETTSSYDSVIYCTVCNEEISRETITKQEKVPEIVFNENTVVITKDAKSYVRIQLGMTAEELIANMDAELLAGETPEFKNLTNDGKLRTGSTITLNEEEKYTIVIKGDVNGDGKIEFTSDIIRANNIRLGLVNASAEEQFLAADVNNDGEIDFTKDIIKINNFRLGLINSL